MGLTTSFSRRELALVGAIAVAYVVVFVSLRAWAGPSPYRAACPADGVIVQVDSGARTLSLCRDGVEAGAFRVALDAGGWTRGPREMVGRLASWVSANDAREIIIL